jgi:hypothetical protein
LILQALEIQGARLVACMRSFFLNHETVGQNPHSILLNLNQLYKKGYIQRRKEQKLQEIVNP